MSTSVGPAANATTNSTALGPGFGYLYFSEFSSERAWSAAHILGYLGGVLSLTALLLHGGGWRVRWWVFTNSCNGCAFCFQGTRYAALQSRTRAFQEVNGIYSERTFLRIRVCLCVCVIGSVRRKKSHPWCFHLLRIHVSFVCGFAVARSSRFRRGWAVSRSSTISIG